MRWQWDHSRRTVDPVKRVIVPNSFPLKPEHLPVLNVEIFEKVGSKIFLRCILIFDEFLFSETNRVRRTAIVDESFVLHRNRKDVFCFYRILRSRAMIAVLIKRFECSLLLSLSLSRRFITSLVRLLWPSIIALIVYKPWMENGRN